MRQWRLAGRSALKLASTTLRVGHMAENSLTPSIISASGRLADEQRHVGNRRSYDQADDVDRIRDRRNRMQEARERRNVAQDAEHEPQHGDKGRAGAEKVLLLPIVP